ncbi:MAG: S-layer homology domain-containing protein [Lawsonibacter sp.]|nr:S-layer homology domain-containing protein [Lawsonibacter sp.]
MRVKRILSALLTGALALSLVVLPASAAPGSFIDVTDPNTAVNADILRLMGVVSGTGGNMFNPGGTLTRAQFCTMAVNFLQKGEEAPRYATRTIFSDVKSGHWARSYINLAASDPSLFVKEGGGEDSKGVPLISGVGDGTFQPDNNISLAEAVTILLRALGYTSKEAGAVWPQGYMDLAGSVGLLDGLDAGASAPITRAQAAQLFVNALSCKKQDGKVYYTTIGQASEDKTIILAVNVEADDGSASGAIRTTSNKNAESYLPAHGDANVTALQGRRGHLVLDGNQEIVAFVPDKSTATTIVLNGDAQPGYVKAGSGQQYTISGSALVYASGEGEGKNYSEAYTTLLSGAQITMYAEKGKIVAIYSTSGSTTASTDAVVVQGNATAATFHRLTGGVTNFNIIKDRQPITLSQIKPYDVVTYDAISNTLVVSDLRMTAVYTDPTPNPKAPEKLKVMEDGEELTVLESAWDTIGDTKPGESVSLLLTADCKVAGIVKPSAQTRSTAVGFVEGKSVSIFLPDGTTKKLGGSVANSSSVADGEPVIVSAGRSAYSVSKLPTNRAPGDFNVAGMKLGTLTVSSGVRIYEQVKGGVMRPVDRGSLEMATVSAEKVTGYHTNSAGYVDYIILNDVTGTAYIYGMMVGGYEERKVQATDDKGNLLYDDKGDPVYEIQDEWYAWHLRSGSEEIDFTRATTYKGRSGDMVGVVIGKPMGGGENDKDKYIIRSVVQLTEIHSVKSGDFFESQGVPYVNVNGKTYRISDDVECYYNRTGNKVSRDNWLRGGVNETGAGRLASIRTYSDTFSIYVDPTGQQVRIITAD